ncbi:alkaline phosphatase family protein [Amycolatopsis sp. NPDC023774]|uniref:alkaline phosphatase family protein n=1 Tax=Amycolatopsis sp. NPDC023774 TaxID=3155015 RepID=UPI00340175DE
MSVPSRGNALDHVVVVMFENRSFDNLLGRLYEPGEVASFDGVIGKDLSNRVPDWAEHRPPDRILSYGVAADMNTPSLDPGEEFPHVNTQLFGVLDEDNRFKVAAGKSFNHPPAGRPSTMDGFVADYISVVTDELGRQPTVQEYSRIMTGYTPAQMPVLSALARGFATFDHWFCDVPTCTYPNRSFFHAGASSGLVVNTSPPGSFPRTNDAETLFDRLDAAGLTWKVYCDPPSIYSLTGVIHAPRLAGRFATNFCSTRQFFQDAEKGQLPTYSFVEPQIIGWNHNDMHPPFGGVVAALGKQLGATDAASLHFDPPSSLIGGEDLLARIYNAIRNSSSANGSNHLNTTLLVTFDEHGGSYDHVPPPPAVPPDRARAHGQMGFGFDRAGVRVPTLAISAWIPQRTVVNDEFRATSLLATMRRHFNLGRPLSARDAGARSFADIFTLTSPRAQEDWPHVTPRPVPEMPEALAPLDAPLGLLGTSLLHAVLAFAQGLGKTVPDINPDETITGARAIDIAHESLGDLFPAIRN